MNKRICGTLIGTTLLLFSNLAFAVALTCGGPDRVATLSSAETCDFGLGNPKVGDILGYHPGDPWTDAGELTGDGTDNYLTASLTSGSWGGIPIAGIWEIAPDFWTDYSEAVISMHVGNGGGDPDHWAWLITPDELVGDWSLDKLSGGGGGISNLRLWGRGEGTDVPEPSVLWLLSIGLLGLGLVHRIKG